MFVVTLGASTLAMRGRVSFEYCPRTSSSSLGVITLVNCPTTVFVESRSVPLLDRALVIVGKRLLPTEVAFSASLELWL